MLKTHKETSVSKLGRALLVCPTLNPGALFDDWLKAFNEQTEKPIMSLIIDSASDDGTIEKAKKMGFIVSVINRGEFNHGGTRQKAIDENENFDYVIYLTQDAILFDSQSLSKLLAEFDDPNIAAVCGRQLPRKQAGVIEAHARLYNYTDVSTVNSLSDASEKGLKAAFMSNSFAAYRVSSLKEVGGFPKNVIFGEDMYVAAKMILNNYNVAYASDACVYHSHGYSITQEVKRYFDMGVFHAREPWIRKEFGSTESEGIKFVFSEFKYLVNHAIWKIPEAMLRTLCRYGGFRLGLLEHKLPLKVKMCITMNKRYFK